MVATSEVATSPIRAAGRTDERAITTGDYSSTNLRYDITRVYLSWKRGAAKAGARGPGCIQKRKGLLGLKRMQKAGATEGQAQPHPKGFFFIE